MKFQPHPYHLVEPSPWPLAASIALLTTTVSAVCLFHGYGHGGVCLTIGLLAVLSTMGLWWADVIREGKIFNKDVPSINLTVCWKLLRAFGPLSYLAARNNPRIGQSAGNQWGLKLDSLSRVLRDYTSSVGRFMHSQSYTDKIFWFKSSWSLLGWILEGDLPVKLGDSSERDYSSGKGSPIHSSESPVELQETLIGLLLGDLHCPLQLHTYAAAGLRPKGP